MERPQHECLLVFGADVPRRAERAPLRHRGADVDVAREPDVAQPSARVAVEQDVGALDVAVHDARLALPFDRRVQVLDARDVAVTFCC